MNEEEKKKRKSRYNKTFYNGNKENILKYHKSWRTRHPDYYRDRRRKNPEFFKEKDKKYLSSPQAKLKNKIHCSINNAFINKKNKQKNVKTWENVLPFTLMELRGHLEKKFLPGMDWTNHGRGKTKWQIDHIKPDSSFHYNSVKDKDFFLSWKLNNLQPLWGIDNLEKAYKQVM